LQVLNDWNSGRLRYYTEPPTVNSNHSSAEILAEYSSEFQLDQLDDAAVLSQVRVDGAKTDTGIPYLVSGEDGDEEMEDGGQCMIDEAGSKKKKVVAVEMGGGVGLQSMEIDGNVQLNKVIKQAVKKGKRQKKKLGKDS
jgi:nuclear GTP-binding protein